MKSVDEDLKKKVRKIKELFSKSKKPLILIYSNPDPDALASAWALSHLTTNGGRAPVIGYTGDIGRVENETMVNVLKIKSRKIGQKEIDDADLIAIVDGQPDFFKDVQLPRCDIVIDHHPKRTSVKSCAFIDIRSSCLATASILTNYLMADSVPISKKLATALHYGLQTDSRNMQKSPTALDVAAIHFLELKIDRSLIRRIELSSYSLNSLNYFSVALAKLRYASNIVYTDLGTVPTGDICVQVAEFLVRAREANWAIVSGVVEQKLVIIFRCDGHKKNAGALASAAFGEIGSAGGHRTMARAEIQQDSLPGGILITQNEKIEYFILAQLASCDPHFLPVKEVVEKALQ